MIDWSSLHLLRPWWLLALLPALLLAWALLRRQSQSAVWRRYIAPEFLPYLLELAGGERRRWPLAGLLAGWALACLALAGPVWEKVPQPVLTDESALVLLWDLSPSMLAEDVKPSRLTRARLKLIDLLKGRGEGQAALVAYSAEAYPVTPLTDDNQTIINLLPALAPTTLPSVGSNPEMALEVGARLLNDAGAQRGTIVYVTDAIDADAFDYIADVAADLPYEVVIWGVGTPEGAPIPLPTGGFARDAGGTMVVPKLNEAELARFAVRIGGHYLPMQKNDSDIKGLLRILEPSSSAAAAARSNRTFDQWFEHGQWLALLLLPAVALWFRRGVIFALVLLPLAWPMPAPAAASDWFLNQEQRIQKRVESGEDGAAQEFTDPARRGVQLYKDESYANAATAFQQADPASSALDAAELAYNRGTALTQSGDYDAAIEAFDTALASRPDYADASHNRAIAERLRERQQQQQEQQQQQGQEGEQDPSEGDQSQNPQDGSDSADSSEQAGSEQQAGQSDAQAGDTSESGEPATESENATADGTPEGDNPYSELQQEPATAGEPSEDEQAESQGTPIAEAPQSEEEQMLEQLLRKVPDDPSGLLRNKFKYQYLQRRQQLPGAASPRDRQAEQRW